MIKKCMFPAGGLGTRFLPATKSLPKEMLPIVDTPLLQYGVDEARDAGLNEISIVTGKYKRAIEDYFDKNYEIENSIKGNSKEKLLKPLNSLIEDCKFSYTRQREAKGLGQAILTGEILIGNQPFGVILADDLCINQGDGVMTQMLEVYQKYRCSIVAIEEVAPQDVEKYGIIKGEKLESNIFKINDMIEKPKINQAPSKFAIIGRYILTPDIFDILRNTKPGINGELQITDALLQQAKAGKVIGFKFQGLRFDCGSVNGFMKANNYFYGKRQ